VNPPVNSDQSGSGDVDQTRAEAVLPMIAMLLGKKNT
jgi:hypothetical protein